MVLVAYEYVGDSCYKDYHYDCDWVVFMEDYDAKHAILHFWNYSSGSDNRPRHEHRDDFIIKEVVVGEYEIEKYKALYWENEPKFQQEPASER